MTRTVACSIPMHRIRPTKMVVWYIDLVIMLATNKSMLVAIDLLSIVAITSVSLDLQTLSSGSDI